MPDTPQRNKRKKHKKRRKIAQEFIFSIGNVNAFLLLFRLYTKINKSWKINVSSGQDLFRITDFRGNSIYILHKSRIPFYKSGVTPRASGLLGDYMVDLEQIDDHDVFLDCGANIGELGMALRLAGKTARYVAFEPGEDEHRTCLLNNPDAACEKVAIWNETCTLNFYEKSDTADSSVVAFGEHERVTRVPATTIDEYCAANDIKEIKYLKIEAEGAEPEALEGAVKTLQTTHFVTVDCGYERGVDKESTLPRVCNQLIRSGFDLIKVRDGRLVALFENTKLRRGASPVLPDVSEPAETHGSL